MPAVTAQGHRPAGSPGSAGGQFDFVAHPDPGLSLDLAAGITAENYEAELARALSAARAYEMTDVEEMTDPEFDRLLAAIREYEDANGIEPDHDLYSVGHGGASGGDVEHATRMLSLEKPGEEKVIEFAAAHPNAVIEPKIDGLALSVQYRDGRLYRAARRGDGYTGEDVTDKVRGVDGLPESAGDGDYEVRGELYLNDANKARANEIRVAAGKKPFANARNGVAGMLNKGDDTYKGLFSFAAYSTTMKPEDADHLESMAELEGLGFTTARSLLPQSVLDAEDPMSAIAALGAERKGLGFLMDGAVLKVPTAAEREALGEGSSAPKWAVAYKYPAVEEPTVIEDIEYEIGKTGRLSIRARLTPVEVDGSVVEYASLHNVGHLAAADLRIGDSVMAYKANDIIPQVHLPRAELRDPASQPWQPPAACPKCGGEFDKSTELWRCTNPECSVSGRISYAVSRDAGLDVEGFGGSIGDALIEADLVRDVSDIFSLTKEQLANLKLGTTDTGADRTLGEKNAAKIMAEIEKAKSQPLNRVITALSMRFTGRTFGRRLAAEFGTMEALQAATVTQLANVEGIGEKKAEVIHAELAKNAPVIERLRAAGVNMGAKKAAGGTALAGQTVVVTGSVKSAPALAKLSRSGVQELIEAHGGKASGSVSKSTTLLVCGEPGSAKFVKGQELGVKIVSPTEFAGMLGL